VADKEMAQFSHHRLKDGRRHAHVYYKTTEVLFDWPDDAEGFAHLKRTVEILENVMKLAMDDMSVRDELKNLDQEIADLLDGDEE
jgi:hypothetical protein